ncbi:hypothetical protein BAUCODRAFT_37813 [Baudoinia panamericana UAMH 10762]|uniref:Integral membrane protein TmpA n=1 Tax=Baudoinia panamericana (strain UAMH 10762) TaxID=717646 RepID=M2LFU3_BAUPA|nr:uncharacterized protein BAUCODRAFT_37813 [Baudoinia panamericana UAMH 10762]EMC92902.1 hypothetical protein BAUCODRAFT_37813 [Baudoinia panamericana UAMH 10762]
MDPAVVKAVEKDIVHTSIVARSPDASSATTTMEAHSQPEMIFTDLEKGIVKTETAVVPNNLVHEQKPRRTLKSLAWLYFDYAWYVALTPYRQLWTLVVCANLSAILAVVACSDKHLPSMTSAANAAVANLLMAVLVRQDYMKNVMYHTCWSIPHSAPLWLRRRLALVYENGGVHSGAAVSTLMWFVVFTGSLWTSYAGGNFSDVGVLLLDLLLAILLSSIVVTAIPQVRRRYHDLFENAHRWAGWFGIALFWVSLVLLARDQARASASGLTIGQSLVQLPAFWLLIIISCHAIYPWLLLRKVAVVRAERLTDHAIRIYYDPRERIPALHGVAISDAPLYEWHGFAAIPPLQESDKGAFSSIISRAGDWTAKTIESPRPYYYMRGIHATGVLAMAQVFRRVVVMATGSGIGPCLALFGAGTVTKTKIHIIWSAPSPRTVFGDPIYDAVLRKDPEATIWDTRKDGRRPDMVELAEDMYHAVNAEAVFFISNRDLTRKVIAELRRRRVAAYAPIFDS